MQAVVESLHGFLRRSSTVEPQTRAALVLETEYRRLLGSTILALRPNDTTAEEARRVSGVIPLALDHWSLILNFLTNAPLERRIGIARALNVDVLAGLGRNLGLDANDAARLRADLLALLRSSGTVALPEAFGTVARLLRAMHPTADFWAEHAPILATAPPVARREFLHQLSLLPRAGVVLIETLSDLLADPVARPFAVEALTRFETELDAGTRRRLAEARSESSTADGATTSVEAASLAAFLRTCMRDGQAPFSNN